MRLSVLFRGFHDERNGAAFGESGDGFEAFQSDVSAADVFVAVHAAADEFFGVVEVEAGEGADSDELVVFFEGLLDGFLGGNVVAGGPDVSGVQTGFDARGEIFEFFPDLTEFFQTEADFAALAGGVFQDVLEAGVLGEVDDFFGVFDDVFHGFFACAVQGFADVDDDAVAAEEAQTFKIRDNVFYCPRDLVGGFSKIQQIGAVGDDVFDVVLFAVFFELFGVLRVDGLHHAASRGFGEKLHGVAAKLFDFEGGGFERRLGESARDGHVCAKDEHGLIVWFGLPFGK